MASAALVLNVGVALAVATFAFALMLLFVSLASWARLRATKLLVVGGAFALLAVAGGLASWRAIVDRTVDLPNLALNAGILGFLYASVAMR